MKDGVKSFRDTLKFFEKECVVIDKEVNPKLEIAGIEKALDGGPPIVFNNIKGYKNMRVAGNLQATRENIYKLFGLNSHKEALEWGRNALRHPTPPNYVTDAPCQEVVIDKNIDLMKILPVLTHSERDVGPIIGCCNYLFAGELFDGGMEISFKRTMPMGKDWCSVMAVPGSHIRAILDRNPGKRIPVTANMGTPPSVLNVSGAGVMPVMMPFGGNEIGVAGTMQGGPVDLVKAKTVDAYAVAESEIVLEGYITATRNVWESEAAREKGGRLTPFFPEWPKYLGRAREVYKFEVTAVTHRKNPIYYAILADSLEADCYYAMLRESALYHNFECMVPGLVQDVYQLYPAYLTTRIQIKKRAKFDDGWERNLIENTFATYPGTKLVVVVDEDVDVRDSDEVIWAVATRASMEQDLMMGAGGKGVGMMPIEITDKQKGEIVPLLNNTRGLGIYATIPFKLKDWFERAKYPSFKVDLEKFVSDKDIARVRTIQSDYAKRLAKIGG